VTLAEGPTGDGRDDRIPSIKMGRGSRADAAPAGEAPAADDPLLDGRAQRRGESDLIGAETQGATPEDLDQSGFLSGLGRSGIRRRRPGFLQVPAQHRPDGKLFDPREEAVPTHRCGRLRRAVASLTAAARNWCACSAVHVSCPRYMRGTLLAEESATAAAAEAAHIRDATPYLTIAGLRASWPPCLVCGHSHHDGVPARWPPAAEATPAHPPRWLAVTASGTPDAATPNADGGGRRFPHPDADADRHADGVAPAPLSRPRRSRLPRGRPARTRLPE